MDESNQAPGFFGKLPSHGDFVGRRLPPAVRDCFDRWAQAGLVQSRIDLGEAWTPAWLRTPLWRFLVGAGICGDRAWAGVMMPSHDRVGRCFPLLLAAGIDGAPSLSDCLTLHDGWFLRLEELALSALEEAFTLEAFDAALVAQGGAPACHRPGIGPMASAHALAALAPPTLSAALLDGQSAWWTTGSPEVAPSLAIAAALPGPTMFSAFLDGHWEERGAIRALSGP